MSSHAAVTGWHRVCIVILLGWALAFSSPSSAPPKRLEKEILQTSTPASLDLRLPLLAHSIRFAVIGDSGTGQSQQYAVAAQMERYRQQVGYNFAVMLGDNIYGGHSDHDFRDKFERPYAALLTGGVKFYASLGNHDDPDVEILYKPFNMNGHRYYSYSQGDVDFYALDSDYMDPAQVQWLKQQLGASKASWKIAYFHHPLYSDGKFHGPDLDLRKVLMPVLVSGGVNLVLSGHDHVYERIKPQQGIYFFVVGDSGQLRYHNLRRPSEEMEDGSDTLQDFMMVEISGDQLYYQTVSGAGQTVDSGAMPRLKPMPAADAATDGNRPRL